VYNNSCEECLKFNTRTCSSRKVDVVEIEDQSGEDEEQLQEIDHTAIDFTQDRYDRRAARKKKGKTRKSVARDPVKFIDLPVTSNYDEYFSNCLHKKLNLNHKGPLSNLHYSFKAVLDDDQGVDSDEITSRKVISTPCDEYFITYW